MCAFDCPCLLSASVKSSTAAAEGVALAALLLRAVGRCRTRSGGTSLVARKSFASAALATDCGMEGGSACSSSGTRRRMTMGNGGCVRSDEHRLIEAIEARYEAEVERLLDSPDAAFLLRARSIRNCTPLMLAVMGHCSPRLAEKMLAHGPEAVGVACKSSRGKTAAQYAELHGAVELAARLRELEAVELRRTASGRCPVCAACVSHRPKLAMLWTRAERGEETNGIVQRFFGRGESAVMPLLSPQFHTLNDDADLSKKLSQSLAVIEALERQVSDLNGWHVVDLCCGKSLTTSLIVQRHPYTVLTAVDRVPASHLPHYAEAGIDTVTYSQADVLGESFLEELMDRVAKVRRPTAVLGMHLCGRLSERAIEAFRGCALIQVCVLSPCCLPHADDAPEALRPLYRNGVSSEEQSCAWAAHLEGALSAEPGAKVQRELIADIMSIKNTVLTAWKMVDIRADDCRSRRVDANSPTHKSAVQSQ